eukprot:6648627-Alexandrium_andersonii.AAC.1
MCIRDSPRPLLGATPLLPPALPALLFVRQSVPGIFIAEDGVLPDWLSGALPAAPPPYLVLGIAPRAPPASVLYRGL